MKRDDAIDIAKAIGILLMILGHCHGIPWILRNFIFSFHMPLFFIFSGFFYKTPQNMNEMVKKKCETFGCPLSFYLFGDNHSLSLDAQLCHGG